MSLNNVVPCIGRMERVQVGFGKWRVEEDGTWIEANNKTKLKV